MNCTWEEKKTVKVIQADCLEAKLVTFRQARATKVLSGLPKITGCLQRAPGGKFSSYICRHSYLLFPGEAGWEPLNNKLVHVNLFLHLWVLVPRNRKFESTHWQFYMRSEKLDIAKINFCNPHRPFFHQEQYCPEQETLKGNGLKYSFMWEAWEDL